MGENGAGIYAYTNPYYSSGTINIDITNSTIANNQTGVDGNGSGGGIYAVVDMDVYDNSSGGVNINVTSSEISGNIADESGGGIYASTIYVGGIVKVNITNSTISNNDGGGIYAGYTEIFTVVNSVIANNTADGINGANFAVVNSVIASNYGEGISGKGLFINNIFTGNNSDINFTGNSKVYNNYIDYTKLQNETLYTIVKKNNLQPSAGSLNFADTEFRLGANSIAIDKGLDPNSSTFKNLFTNPATLAIVLDALKTDKDVNLRIAGPAIDLGAYEYGSISVNLTSVDFGSVNVGKSSIKTLTIANAGTADHIIGTITLTGTDASEFSILNDTCSGQTIAPSGTCRVDVRFSPKSGTPARFSMVEYFKQAMSLFTPGAYKQPKSANLSIPSKTYLTTVEVPLSGKRYATMMQKILDIQKVWQRSLFPSGGR